MNRCDSTQSTYYASHWISMLVLGCNICIAMVTAFFLLAMESYGQTKQATVPVMVRKNIVAVRCMTYSPDGTQILAGYEDGCALLWNVTAKNIVRVFQGNQDHVFSVAISPDGEYAAVSYANLFGNEGEVRVWGISSGKEEQLILCHEDRPVASVQFDAKGKHLLIGENIWNWRKATKEWSYQNNTQWTTASNVFQNPVFRSSQLSRDNSSVLLAGFRVEDHNTTNGFVVFMDRKGDNAISLLGNHKTYEKMGNDVYEAIFHPEGTHFLLLSTKGVHCFDIGRRTFVRSFQLKLDGTATAIAYSADGRQIVVGIRLPTSSNVAVCDANTGQTLIECVGHVDAINCVTFSPDGTKVLAGLKDGSLIVWNAKTGKQSYRLKSSDTMKE